MFDVSESLRSAFADARGALRAAQAAVAAANAGSSGGRKFGAAMAATARAALFTEALLAAQHARLEELKAVTR
jgi:hypothetical protein